MSAQTRDLQRIALQKFVHPDFQEYIEEFLVGASEDGPAPVTQYSADNEWDLIGSFAAYCYACGLFEEN